MQKYLADILTLMRLILSTAMIVLAITGGAVSASFVMFVLAELTDSFDGTCAKRWPFPAGKEPKYRKYAVKYDMFADMLLWFAAVLTLTLRINLAAGLIVMFGTAIICGLIELIVYGRAFGHPNNCSPRSLCARNFVVAKRIIMMRRWFYLATIVMVAAWILVAAEWSELVKIIVFASGLLILVFLWFFLKQRRQHISRDAVELEDKLTKKAQQ